MWMISGSIVPFFEILAVRAGPVEMDTADGHLSREIMCVSLFLAAFLDDLHPHPPVYSSGIERLVRRLVLFEEATSFSARER